MQDNRLNLNIVVIYDIIDFLSAFTLVEAIILYITLTPQAHRKAQVNHGLLTAHRSPLTRSLLTAHLLGAAHLDEPMGSCDLCHKDTGFSWPGRVLLTRWSYLPSARLLVPFRLRRGRRWYGTCLVHIREFSGALCAVVSFCNAGPARRRHFGTCAVFFLQPRGFHA